MTTKRLHDTVMRRRKLDAARYPRPATSASRNEAARRRLELLVDALEDDEPDALELGDRQQIAEWFRAVLRGERFEKVAGLVGARGRRSKERRDDLMRRDFALHVRLLGSKDAAIDALMNRWGRSSDRIEDVVLCKVARAVYDRDARDLDAMITERVNRDGLSEAEAMRRIALYFKDQLRALRATGED
jgi:hypothetical protein